jgi:Ras-related GTP-binding protein A/B
LINKMDLADKEDPARKKFGEKKAEITAINDKVSKEKDRKGQIRIFGTTIWDESLYKVSQSPSLLSVLNLIDRHGRR